MRAPRLKTVSTFTALAAIALAAGACAESKRDPEKSKKDTLIFAVEADAKVLDPALANDGPSLRVAKQIMETLVVPEEGGSKIVPGLATSFTPDASGLVWTFKLKTGVKFHDNTDFNAEAVCFNFNRWYNFSGLLQTADVSNYWQDMMGGFAKNEVPGLGVSLFKSCQAKATDEAVITITRSTSKFPAVIALPSFSISSPKALKDFEADKIGGNKENITYPKYAEHPVGTGRYKFVSWDRPGKVIKMDRWDGYHGETAKIKNLHFKTIADINARKQALEAGTVDGYDLVAPQDIEPLRAKGFNPMPRPAFNVLYLAINQSGNPALKKLEVRQAIAHAINRQAIINAKFPAGATVATNFHPDSIPGHNKDVKKYEFDTARAKSLLAAAGVPNLKLRFHYPTDITRAYLPAPKDIFELIKADLEKAGITVEAIPLEWSPEYLSAVQARGAGHDLHLLGWNGDFADAYNFIGRFFDRFTGEWGFNDPALFAEFAAADKEPDPVKRAELYKALNAKLLEFLPGVPIAHSPSALVLAKNVLGVKPSPLLNEQYAKAYFSS